MDKFFREVRKKLYFSRDDDINFATHIHDDIEIIYVIRGGGTAYCDGKKYLLGPGSIFIVFPEQIHSYVDCSDGEYILLTEHNALARSRSTRGEQHFRHLAVCLHCREGISLVCLTFFKNGIKNCVFAIFCGYTEKRH